MSVDSVINELIENFFKINEQFAKAGKEIRTKSTINLNEKNNLYLQYIAVRILPNPQYFNLVVEHFAGILPKLVCIAINLNEKTDFCYGDHILKCILLGKLVKTRPDLAEYCITYFQANPSPFIEKPPVVKKLKMMEEVGDKDLEIVKCCYALLKSNPNFYRNCWCWSDFIVKYLEHQLMEIRWISCHCIAIVTGMNEHCLKSLINSRIPAHEVIRLSCIYNFEHTLQTCEQITTTNSELVPLITKPQIGDDYIVEVAGVYIPKVGDNSVRKHNLEMVDSTYNNLKKIALSLSSGKAICLKGIVGSGKTTLIEYLAEVTGRSSSGQFIKVQLGDQTDSKMLLGTYSCTDIPGEFIWQPGVVTQAVTEGHWLLLEDIDSASADIASVLSSLLENSSLSVPGYRDSIPVKPGFQLFFTQRLVSTITGHHRRITDSINLLEKNLSEIHVDPLTTEELKQIVAVRYPIFKNLTDRMLGVFHLFSHDLDGDKQIILPKTSRLISTRDFFKWCSRAADNFNVSSQETALKILQDAIDVFCCSYSNVEESLNLAKEISSLLGIIHQKAEYFIKLYKPTLQLTASNLQVGRASINRDTEQLVKFSNYYFTRSAAILLERIICCVNLKEPVLLVGETGTGKTSTVQYLADTIGQKLIVINMNQQSDSADLLGGFKPVDLKYVIAPIKREFEALFSRFYQVGPNKTFLGHLSTCYNSQRWSDLVKLMTKTYQAAIQRLSKPESLSEKNQIFLKEWQNLAIKLQKLELQLKQKSALAFAFIEGSLVKAVEKGYWVLLDEINLANAETLECLSGLLEDSDSSLCLLEKGDKEPVKRHKNFTLFACMNPSTDVGKKDLPAGLRNRFTEFYIDELTEKNDLLLLVTSYLNAQSLKPNELSKIVDFYLKVRNYTQNILTDGLGQKPHFSLRSLCRALTIAARNPCATFKRSLYEAFCLSFLTQLDATSYRLVEQLIGVNLIGDAKALKSILNQPIPSPTGNQECFVPFEGYWVKKGGLECIVPEDYVLTESVRKNLKDLVRIVSIGGLPVLLQGDTSVGKTSLITYLAKASGNKCVRINNHEHTDLQEYIGSYVADCDGKLVFREGLLVDAMRKGHWIILDELNLAPTDVLEALNRVLDDNRELFIPETQEVVKASPNFMLFATQNPPGSYGGRKMLSRAFRNRFVELHFNEIPPNELAIILHQRCQIPPSYCKKMIDVMTQLQIRRRGSAAFAGKQGFMTLRDLFRWGERYRLAQNAEKLYDWDQHLADEGYLVLAGKVRKLIEKQEIIEVLQKNLKREVNPQHLFTLSDQTSTVTKDILTKIHNSSIKFSHIVWTYNMRQLAVLIAKAFQFKEPVLLVGETGGGKTTVCEIIAHQNNQKLITVNCHMHTESSDFIGGLRPVRDHHQTNDDDINRLFEWVDGPLIQAMIEGNLFLADEISLADDSVLERLNSLLEPERILLLAEKGSDLNSANNSESVVAAHSEFYFIGTMNPGGDYGKKELSPALRNRFTEIWCESCTDRDDLIAIIERNIKVGLSFGNQQDGSSGIGRAIMEFVMWFQATEIGKRFTVSIRDILTWIDFINCCTDKIDIYAAYIHGACLTFLDSLGSGVTGMEGQKAMEAFYNQCISFLQKQIQQFNQSATLLLPTKFVLESDSHRCGIAPFYIELGDDSVTPSQFCFETPTIRFNALRLLRGMQLNKAILLEGSPGVGKTSIVTALAKITRNKIYRVNLSDQTDISDLFGADLPVEGGTGGQFAWRDGSLLQALKQGHWILLDELNLASQSVLEGLNACLDHRGEIFIPELGKTFRVKPGTRFFACQNPLKQGGSRRGLPKSFLNRFIQVYIDSLKTEDLQMILTNSFPNLSVNIINKMLLFNAKIMDELDKYNFGHKGSPWEFNLRDLTRWCEVMIYDYENNNNRGVVGYRPERLVDLIYGQRMRTLNDRNVINNIFESVFEIEMPVMHPILHINQDKIYFGDVSLKRVEQCSVVANNTYNNINSDNLLVLRSQLETLRCLVYCVNLNWMSLLVGSSACGKSSVVRVLANLAGKNLRTLPVTSAMDTTDILGGFEQTDYSRHLEEVRKETERILYDTIQIELVSGNVDDACKLLQLTQEHCTEKHELSTSTTMQEKTQIFLEKIRKLEEVLTQFTASKCFTQFEDLERLKEKIKILAINVKNEGSLNAGGKFEWVDSVLIKCLQDGSWLLVDNVNLCSAAVLDRLNALLEPNGTLIISERGVDNNGQMIEIKPHPDFRLFFTMDPKNGEISRAMRNRGVEICILNEKELMARDDYDLKSLIILEGLKEIPLVESLLRLHDFINELILGEKSNVNDLLKASALISRELRNGTSMVEAFSRSLLEVYYKTRSTLEFNCNDFCEVLMKEIGVTLETCENYRNFTDEVTLNIKNLRVDSSFAMVKQQSALISIMPDLYTLRYLIIHFYSMSNLGDFNLRHHYLNEILARKNPSLKCLTKRLFDELEAETRDEFPLDFRWIPDTKFNTATENINRILLYLNFVLQQEYERIRNSTSNSTQLSLLQYNSKVIKHKHFEFVDDNLIPNFINFLKEFDKFVARILKVTQISDITFIEIIKSLTWRFILTDFLSINIKQQYETQRLKILNKLKIYSKWLVKYSLKIVVDVLHLTVPKALDVALEKFYKSIDFRMSTLNKLGKKYQKLDWKPPPKWDAIRNKTISFEIFRRLDVCTKNNSLKVIQFLRKNPEIRQKILNNELDDLALELLDNVEQTSNVSDTELLPFIDHFFQLQIRKETLSIDYSDLNIETVPLSLLRAVKIYSSTNKNNRFKHEFFRQYFNYITNSASVQLQNCDSQTQNLTHYNPVLTYHMINLLLPSASNLINLGNFQELTQKHQQMNLMLWRNYNQLCAQFYDYLECEQEIIDSQFKLFIGQLIEILNLKTQKTFAELCEDCLQHLKNTSIAPCLKAAIHFYFNYVNKGDKDMKCWAIANMHQYLGYMKFLLNSELPIIDPPMKILLKKQVFEENIVNFQQYRQSFILLNSVYGRGEILHPHQGLVSELLEDFYKKVEKLQHCDGMESRPELFAAVVRAINDGIRATESLPTMLININQFNEHLIMSTDNQLNREIIQEKLKEFQYYNDTISRIENIALDWSKYLDDYPEILEPLLSNLAQLLYGMKINIMLMKKLVNQTQYLKNGIKLQDEITNLVQIPSIKSTCPNYEFLISSYTRPRLLNYIEDILQDNENPRIKECESLRLLKCGLQEIYNSSIIEMKFTEKFNYNLFNHFERLIKSFLQSWNKQEAERELRAKQADDLYKTKTKCDDKTEQEQIDDELKELFPNYHDVDFSDIQPTSVDNNQMKTSTGTDDDDESTKLNEFAGVISDNDIKFVAEIHLNLVGNFIKTEWLNPVKNRNLNPDFIHPLIEKFKVFKEICSKTFQSLDYTMDRELLASLTVLLAFIRNYNDLSDLEQTSPSRILAKKQDFYRDSNVDEVKSSYHILEELRRKIVELLVEWPDQPTLKTILTIIERIYNFDITSPLSRFLTGFEILLSKCNEWEQVAHSGVSLSKYSQNLTHQIISWRKIELNLWKDLLNTTYERMNFPIYKWWLYLYNIMEQFITENVTTESQLVEILQQFITKSNLAEYEKRLEIIHAFHCHSTYIQQQTKRVQTFSCILWNVYQYFQQFSLTISNKIKELRAPIEKKLKDYVKIVRWKDINYWAIKETVDKSHKMLHKYMREFQDVLNQSVSSCLVNFSDSNKIDSVGIWDRPQRGTVKTYHYTLDASTYMAKESLKKKFDVKFSKLSKLDSYFIKSRKLCRDAILRIKYPSLIQNLDGFVTQIIETSGHLQKLEVDTTLTKDKQKKQAKSILQQKHRALADLFKNLSKIGLSFRAGLVQNKIKAAVDDYLIKPIDLDASFNHINYSRKDEKILTIWDCCERYYLKSLMRADVLATALKTPAPDLGLQNIERCQGFASHLINLAQTQKVELTETSRYFYYLKHYTNQLTILSESQQFISIEKAEEICKLMKNILLTVQQCRIILKTCPEDNFTAETSTEIIILRPEIDFIQFKNDPNWNRYDSIFSDIYNTASKIMSYVEKSKGQIPSFEVNLNYCHFIPVNDIDFLRSELGNISSNIQIILDGFNEIAFVKPFVWMKNEVDKAANISADEYVSFSDETAENLQSLTQKISQQILIIIQNIFKNHPLKSEEETEESDDSLQDDHLKQLIAENLSNDLKILQLKTIFNLIQKLTAVVFKTPPSEELKLIVANSLPLLEQIVLLYQYFLTQQVSAYRITCKMTSILLNIFIDLASKGFCVPPELSDEDSEGNSKPSDGMGLGEGQGEKDVSDKIESEDQLDDAQPAGQEKEDNEDPDCKENEKGIEMSEDFDSKLQDMEQKDDDEDDNSSSHSDADEQMGDTGPTGDKLDQEIWGSDEENEEDTNEKNEEDCGNQGEEIGDQQLGAKDKEKSDPDTNKKDDKSSAEKEEKQKDINEMNEPEYDDQQTDPYHGNQPEMPEPEAMDLPDDLQLDDGEEKQEQTEENPFDIDAMKEDNPFEEIPKDDDDNKKAEESKDDEPNYSSDDEEITKQTTAEELPDGDEDDKNDLSENKSDIIESTAEDNDENKDNETVEETSGIDQTQSNEDRVETADHDNNEGADKTNPNQDQNIKSNQPNQELCQEDQQDKEGVGQSQMEDTTTGHEAKSSSQQETKSSKRPLEEEEVKKQQKPGESDSQRSLGDTNEPVQKKLKTVDEKDGNDGVDDSADDKIEESTADVYKHIKESKDSSTQVLDVATQEQAENQKIQNNEDKEAESEDVIELEDEDIIEQTSEKQDAEKIDAQHDSKKKKTNQHPEGDIVEEVDQMEIEGDVIETFDVTRSGETSHHTIYSDLQKITSASKLSIEEINMLRGEVEQQLSAWNEVPGDGEADKAWQKISSMTSSLAQDLSEQLRLVLEPTQASRLKGDFRTGRRINMRKVIPYIASQFRKDKIWLRRTKPSKRDYQIVLAIDDSSSMADNHSKELAFESVALISKALSLLESGQLSILCFGEKTEILHKLSDQFTEKSGVKLLQKFRFDQNKTCIGKLVDFVTEMFAQSHSQSSALNAKLLVIVSDGRGVFSEGETYVREAVRRAKLNGIFMVFVIIDNPENKHSIFDIRMPVFKEGKLLNIQNYMDVFPFSFYIVLKDINGLPAVLSDALRQWFEVVSNLDKQ